MRVALRPRSFVRVAGPGAEEYLDRMLSNDVAALGPGESCEALLLTREGARDRAARRAAARARGLPAPDRARARRARPDRAAPLPLRGEGRDRAGGAHLARRLRRRRGFRPSDYGEPAAEVLDARARADRHAGRARAAPHPGGHAGVGEGDRRPGSAGRGRADRARGQLHEGLLSGPGADRAAALPRARQPRAPRADARGAAGARRRARRTRARPSAGSRAPLRTATARSPSPT